MKKLFENWRKHLNETSFQDEIKRIEQQYGVSILVSDAEGRYGVSVMHRDEDQLPGEQYPNYSKQPVSYENLEQAEEDIKSRQAQQKMSFDEGGAMGHLSREPTDRMSHSNLPVDSYSREELQRALSDVAKYEQPKYAGSLPDWMPQWIEDVKRRAAEEGILN